MKVGVNEGFRSVTHGFSRAVGAFACHPLTSCMAYAPHPRPSPRWGEGMLEGQGTHANAGRTVIFSSRFLLAHSSCTTCSICTSRELTGQNVKGEAPV